MAADLRIEGEGVRARLVGEAGELKLIVVDAPVDGVRRGRARSLAGVLSATGTRLSVVDVGGRALATAGAGVRSPVGAAVFGTAAIRPRFRAVTWVLARHLRAKREF
jgi:hypothetical protein